MATNGMERNDRMDMMGHDAQGRIVARWEKIIECTMHE